MFETFETKQKCLKTNESQKGKIMKSKSISLKISEKENDILVQKANKSNMNKSEYLRKAGIHSAVEIRSVDKEFQKKLLFLLSNATNNINQIAKRCNIKKDVDVATLNELKKISSDFHSIVKTQL